MEASSSYEATL
jgi:hypothetical protein